MIFDASLNSRTHHISHHDTVHCLQLPSLQNHFTAGAAPGDPDAAAPPGSVVDTNPTNGNDGGAGGIFGTPTTPINGGNGNGVVVDTNPTTSTSPELKCVLLRGGGEELVNQVYRAAPLDLSTSQTTWYGLSNGDVTITHFAYVVGDAASGIYKVLDARQRVLYQSEVQSPLSLPQSMLIVPAWLLRERRKPPAPQAVSVACPGAVGIPGADQQNSAADALSWVGAGGT
jgi:hypothetical protein